MRLLSCILALSLLAAGASRAQSTETNASPVADKVTAGEWDGTWYYVNRDYRLAMWVRTVDGKPQCQLQVMSLFAPEGFRTDWNGYAEYSTREAPGRFHFEISRAGADEISGQWSWDLQFPLSGRREEARFRMYRTGFGRTFALVFDDFTRAIRRGEDERVYTAPRAWTFIKASKRQVLWDELPF